jgi:hypothetical protein
LSSYADNLTEYAGREKRFTKNAGILRDKDVAHHAIILKLNLADWRLLEDLVGNGACQKIDAARLNCSGSTAVSRAC